MADESKEEIEDRDLELLQAAQSAPEGDLRAFEQLIELYQKRILADCRFLTRDENNSEDLAQEVFVKAYFALRTFEGRSTFRHWLQRIKVNHCLNFLKRRHGRDLLSIEEEGMEAQEQLQVPAAAERILDDEARRQRIAGVLNALPATLRVPLVMCDMDELSYDEIAHRLGLGLSAVKMRIKRAREQFRLRYALEEAAAAGRTEP